MVILQHVWKRGRKLRDEFSILTSLGQQEDYLYAVLATNLLIPRYSAEPNVLITSSQAFASLSFSFLLAYTHTTRHDNSDNRDDLSPKLIFLSMLWPTRER